MLRLDLLIGAILIEDKGEMSLSVGLKDSCLGEAKGERDALGNVVVLLVLVSTLSRGVEMLWALDGGCSWMGVDLGLVVLVLSFGSVDRSISTVDTDVSLSLSVVEFDLLFLPNLKSGY